MNTKKMSKKDRDALMAKNERALAEAQRDPAFRRQAEIREVFAESTDQVIDRYAIGVTQFRRPGMPRPRKPAKEPTPPTQNSGRSRFRTDARVRFLSYVEQRGPDECWPWKAESPRFYVKHVGGSARKGLGRGVQVSFRIFAWEQAYGTKPPGKLFPKCANGLCANPRHLTTERPPVIGDTRFIMRSPPDPRKRRTLNAAARPSELSPRQGEKKPAAVAAAEVATETVTSSAAAALGHVVNILDALDARGRARVIAGVRAFYANERTG